MEKIHLIEYHVVDHCNLNCKGCAHFSPLANPWYARIEDFEKDLKRLTSLIEIERFCLFGGEPLLHPQLGEFCKIARKYLPNSDIFILSNGITILEIIPSLVDILKENNIRMKFTQYPLKNVHYDEIENRLNSLGINCRIRKEKNGADKTLRHHVLSHERVKHQSNDDCIMLNVGSVQLRNGRLYLCPIQAYIDIYNNKYHENYLADQFIDIYSDDVTDKDILDFCGKHNDFCDFCRQPKENNKYELSRQEKNEWAE